MAVYTWSPLNGGDLGLAADWFSSAGINTSIPNPGDTVDFTTIGGTITGTGIYTAANITPMPLNPWVFKTQLTAGTTLVQSATTFSSGAILRLTGASTGFLPLAARFNAPITIDGSFLAAAAGEVLVGEAYNTADPAGASLTLQNAAAANVLTLHIGAGATGAVTVTGPGSFLSAVANPTLQTALAETGVFANTGGITIGQQVAVNGVATGGTGSLTLANGGTAGADGSLYLGLDADSSGTLRIGAYSTFTLKGGAANIGNLAGSTGTLTINAGGVFTTTGGARGYGALFIASDHNAGVGSSATGVVLVTGPGTLLDLADSAASIGADGTGTLTVTAAGTARIGIGRATFGLTGLLIGAGGTVNVNGINSSLTVSGPIAALGAINISAGGILNAGDVSLDTNTGTPLASMSTLDITAGGYAALNTLSLGGFQNINSAALVSGPASLLAIATGLTVDHGTLAVAAGGVVRGAAQSNLSIGPDSGNYPPLSVAALTVDGAGSLVAFNTASVADSGSATITITKGATLSLAGLPANSGPTLTTGGVSGQGGTATIILDGAGSTLTTAGANLGLSATTTLTVQNSAHFLQSSATASLALGLSSPGDNPGITVNVPGAATAQIQTGGALISKSDILIGVDTGTGTATVQSTGDIEAATSIIVGVNTSAVSIPGPNALPGTVPTSGTLNILANGTAKTDGHAANGTAAIIAGQMAGATGLINVHGASAILYAADQRIDIGAGGAGGLSVSAGGQVYAGGTGYTDSEAAFTLGGTAGGVGTAIVTGAGSSIYVDGQVILGGTNTGANLTAGGSGTLYATAGGSFRSGSLTMFAGSSIIVDGTSTVVLGSSNGTAGAITVDPNNVLGGAGTISANVVDNGTIYAFGHLTVTAIDAASTGYIDPYGAEIDIGSFNGRNIEYSPGASTIKFGIEGTANVAITGFLVGDTLDLGATTASVSGNTVHLANGATYTFALAAGTALIAASDGLGGTAITASTMAAALTAPLLQPAANTAASFDIVSNAAATQLASPTVNTLAPQPTITDTITSVDRTTA